MKNLAIRRTVLWVNHIYKLKRRHLYFRKAKKFLFPDQLIQTIVDEEDALILLPDFWSVDQSLTADSDISLDRSFHTHENLECKVKNRWTDRKWINPWTTVKNRERERERERGRGREGEREREYCLRSFCLIQLWN